VSWQPIDRGSCYGGPVEPGEAGELSLQRAPNEPYAVADLSEKLEQVGTSYVAYQDGGNSYRATVIKCTGGSWQSVGTGVSLESRHRPVIAVVGYFGLSSKK